MNERIRIKSVRVIDETGNQLGVLQTAEARQIAVEKGLDLVEVSPDASPPVCKIMDYGKYKYEQRKKQQKSRKRQRSPQVKGIRLRPITEEHDIQVKLKRAREFIRHRNKVVINMFFKGRESTHKEIGRTLMERFVKELEDIAKPEGYIVSQRYRLILNLMPK